MDACPNAFDHKIGYARDAGSRVARLNMNLATERIPAVNGRRTGHSERKTPDRESRKLRL